ncbi:MAG TPA: TetR/AcrR family transcriptional regulator [Baekduia sp.]|nr:TetR/AcrR family transcriptional regulator [Baekduia sp.]
MDRNELTSKAAAALANDISASMGDIAAKIGVSRTTLHRNFSSSAELKGEVARFAVQETRRIFDEAGIDDRPARDALESIGDEVLALATAQHLLWADPPIANVAGLLEQAIAEGERLVRFAARGQQEGVFRVDVPAAVLSFSICSQAFAMLYAVSAGYVGERAVKELFLAICYGGLQGQASNDRVVSV